MCPGFIFVNMDASSPPTTEPELTPSFLMSKFGWKSLPPLPGLVLTVFLDLMAFGMFIPDIQIRGKELGLVGIQLGLVLSAYSAAQLVFAPILGSLSDVKGRRIILLTSSCLSIISYILYANMGDSILLMVLSRCLVGAAAGNLSAAFAYAADISTPQNRAASIGALGAAVGVGFIIGPVVGAALISLGHGGTALLGYGGAIFVFINLLYIFLFLPEPKRHEQREKTHPMAMLRDVSKNRTLVFLLIIITMVSLGFTNLESTYFLLLATPAGIFHLGDERARTIGAIFLAVVGVMSALSQGVLVKRLTPRFGEVRLLKFSYPVLAAAFICVPFFPLWVPALCVTACLALSMGISGPNINSLMSRHASGAIQGGVFGISQSLQAMARLIGPVVGQMLFYEKPSYPYLLGGVLVGIGAILALTLKREPMETA